MRLSFCVNIAMRTVQLSDVINQYAHLIDNDHAEDFDLYPESKTELRIWRMHFNHGILAFKRLFHLIMHSTTASEENARALEALIEDTWNLGWREIVLLFFPTAPVSATQWDLYQAAMQTKFVFLDGSTTKLILS